MPVYFDRIRDVIACVYNNPGVFVAKRYFHARWPAQSKNWWHNGVLRDRFPMPSLYEYDRNLKPGFYFSEYVH